ncbi:hypothetical protein KKB44_04620 [Candidatus Micrarchaeota archaeon]|nr:hypothetical protein [Candidatus Micrarchaeota archaeon]
MRLFIILVILLLFGCTSVEVPSNVTNQNITNQTQNITNQSWERHSTEQFSFEYPKNMIIQETTDTFTGEHEINNELGELLIVQYLNTSKEYGVNQNNLFKGIPSQAAIDLLLEDIEDDPLYVLDNAEVGNITSFSIARDTHVAQVPFRMHPHTGYALSLYVPERSLHIKVRVLALNPRLTEDINDHFLLTFRLE